SIVVVENSHRYMEGGLGKKEAIEKGVSEVFLPVTITMICIITAFMPLMLVTGFLGKFIRIIPIVIITCLIASWFIAMFILPAYMDFFLHETNGKEGDKLELSIPMRVFRFIIRIFRRKPGQGSKRMRKAGEAGFQRDEGNNAKGGFAYFQGKYRNLILIFLKYRYITVALLIVAFFITLAVIPVLGFRFITPGGEELIRIKVKFPYSTNLQANLNETRKLEKVVSALHDDEFVGMHTYVGEEYSEIHDPKPGKATYNTTVHIYLTPEQERERTASEISRDMRNRIDTARKKRLISDEMQTRVAVIGYGEKLAVGKPVSVEIRGKDYKIIKQISSEYYTFLSTVEGVRDLSIDLEEGKTEYRYNVNEKMAAMTGISARDIAISLNASFAGAVSTKVNQNEEEVGVRVRFNDNERTHKGSLGEVKVANKSGGLVPLALVTDVKKVKEYSHINRLNSRRLVQVQAEIEDSRITPGKVTDLLQEKFADIEKRYPGYLVACGGEQEYSNKSMAELKVLFIGALLIIFVVLAVYMHSLVMPVVVMIAIPFALIGVVFALAVHGQPMSFFSVLGLFSLAGVIVSNTLVLVQFINKFRDEGLGLKDAIAEGGVVRLRPIILTAGSTVLNLMPVIYGFGGRDYMVAPLALAFGYGLIFATVITLILIPCFYHIAEDLKRLLSRTGVRIGVTISPFIYDNSGAGDN
ncbi:MAG TPA: efflux RND transporter permease subunit, partial [Spirochaetota bacterium]|nr:efflux RND transporter permease subunit [Spirochaetota bacterium]